MRNVNMKHMLLAGTVAVLLAVSLNVSAVQNSSFSRRELIRTAPSPIGAPIGDLNNVAWTASPDVFIDTDDAQPIGDTSAVIFVMDAISDYWDDEGDVDDDDDDPAGSDAWKNFDSGGFGTVDSGSDPPGWQEILIVFEALPGDVLGVTDIEYNPATGTISYAVIAIDTGIGNADTLKNVVAHELGHAIGLGHGGPPYTLMHPFYYPYEAYLQLWMSSRITLQRLYG